MSALSFDGIDELFQAHALGDTAYLDRNLLHTDLAPIGPLAEYVFQTKQNRYGLPDFYQLPTSPSVQAMSSAYAAPGIQTSLQPRPVEFRRIPTEPAPFQTPAWIAYQKRLEGACSSAGFPRAAARSICGAFGEMADNIVRHSGRHDSGLTGYRWMPGSFEYLVADAGIGLLASLRSSADYLGLRDHAQALQTALQPNESRFGRKSGHGTGFNYVFTSLANLYGSLRFRTGDQVLGLDGKSPHLPSAQVRQCPPFFQGFLVSVVCRTTFS